MSAKSGNKNKFGTDGYETVVNDNVEIENKNFEFNKTDATLRDPFAKEENKSYNLSPIGKDEIIKGSPVLSTSDVNCQLKKPNMIIYHGRNFICLLIIVLTVYGTYQNVLHQESQLPNAKAFFSIDSFVKDYPSGDLFAVQTKVTLSDLSFVMFYAPWSAESQHARPNYEFVAKLFYKEATFSAINCWQPNGECRQQYRKVMSWPVLMAYNQNNIAIPYNGQWTKAALARFILLLMRPLHRINQPENLLSLIQNHDAVVVLFVNMDTSSSFYNIYLHVAIKWLERDPYGDVAFAVVTGEAMTMFGVDREPSMRLYLWNETIEYEDTLWKPSLLQKWILSHVRQVSYWLSPPGSKSTEFVTFIEKGPALVLFTPRNLFDTSNDAYAMLRQIGYEYFNCEQDDWLKEMSRNYIYYQRKENFKEFFVRKDECEQFSDWKISVVQDKCTPFDKQTFIGLVNSSKYHYNSANDNYQTNEYCSIAGNNHKSIYNEGSCNAKTFSTSKGSEQSGLIEYGMKTSMLNTSNDLRSSKNIVNIWKSISCKIDDLSRRLRSKLFYDSSIDKSNASDFNFNKINGLACKFNRSLSFLAMDSFTYELVAEKLGISLKNVVQGTAAVIVDGQDESSYVLNEPLTTNNLIDFVHDYTINKLNRHLRNNGNVNHSYHYSSVNSQNSENYHPKVCLKTQAESKIRTIELSKISSINFTEFIWESDKTTAVLFSSTQCAFCTIFSSILLTISRILSDANYLSFVRIDGDKNDLPWEFTMDTIPSLIVFNGNKKSESRKFPTSLPITVQNVLGFVLSNLNRPNRLSALVSIAKYKSQKKFSIEADLIVLRHEIEENIVANLKIWRKFPFKRAFILRRVQALRQLYLVSYHQNKSSDLNKLDKLVQNVLNVWKNDDSMH